MWLNDGSGQYGPSGKSMYTEALMSLIDEFVNRFDYVIDRDRKLVGSVGLRSLILSDPDCRVEELMHENPIHAHTLDDQESVAKLFSRYDMLALPVVDNEERLVGNQNSCPEERYVYAENQLFKVL